AIPVLPSAPAQPPATNRPEKIFQDFMRRRINSGPAKEDLLALLKNSINLPERIEAAERFAKVCGQVPRFEMPVGRGNPPEQAAARRARQIAESRLAIETTLPLLGSLDEEHRKS